MERKKTRVAEFRRNEHNYRFSAKMKLCYFWEISEGPVGAWFILISLKSRRPIRCKLKQTTDLLYINDLVRLVRSVPVEQTKHLAGQTARSDSLEAHGRSHLNTWLQFPLFTVWPDLA